MSLMRQMSLTLTKTDVENLQVGTTPKSSGVEVHML